MLPATAAAAEGKTGRYDGSAPAATWSLLATLGPGHPADVNAELQLFGVYAFTSNLVNFNPKVLHPSINQSAVLQYAVPRDFRSHTYKVVFNLTTDVTTTTSYRLNNNTPITVPGGPLDLEFIETIGTPSWHPWALRNANNDHWLFYWVKIYEQIG